MLQQKRVLRSIGNTYKEEDENADSQYTLSTTLKNESPIFARYIKLKVEIPEAFFSGKYSDTHFREYVYSNLGDDSSSIFPLHPYDTFEIEALKLHQELDSLPKDMTAKYEVFADSAMPIKKEITLSELLLEHMKGEAKNL